MKIRLIPLAMLCGLAVTANRACAQQTLTPEQDRAIAKEVCMMYSQAIKWLHLSVSSPAAEQADKATMAGEWKVVKFGWETDLFAKLDAIQAGQEQADTQFPGKPLSPQELYKAVVPAFVTIEVENSVPAGVKAPTLSVTADGIVSGFAGVNNYSGALAKDGDKLFDGFRITLMFGPPAARKVEKGFVKALVSVTRFTIQNDTLTLFAGDDARLVLSKNR